MAGDRLQVKLQPWSSAEQGLQQLLILNQTAKQLPRLGCAMTSAQSLGIVAAATVHAADRAVMLGAAGSWY